MIYINLQDYAGDALCYIGRDKGTAIRKTLKLDEIDNSEELVLIFIRIDLISMSGGFFQNLFNNSILKLGKNKFYEKYTFVGKNFSEFITKSVDFVINLDSNNKSSI